MTQEWLNTCFLYDDSISPTLIGVKPSFEDNLFNIHSLGVSFPVPILLLFLQYSINKLLLIRFDNDEQFDL